MFQLSSDYISAKQKEILMPRKPLESLGAIVRERRGGGKLRETAHVIGIGPATLMRVENGRIPDIETFRKICLWLKTDPNSFLGFESTDTKSSNEQPMSSISAHFRLDQTPEPDTVSAIAKMVLYALRSQPKSPPEL